MFGVSHAVQNEKLWNLHTWYRVIGEVLVIGLLVVVYKIPYIQQLYVNQARCNWCAPIVLLLFIWCNVCACHSPVYHYIAAHHAAVVQYITIYITATCDVEYIK